MPEILTNLHRICDMELFNLEFNDKLYGLDNNLLILTGIAGKGG